MQKILFILAIIYSSILYADVAYELRSMRGWTIVDVKTIESFREPGQNQRSGFRGCNGDTLIYFMDGSIAQCMSLGLQLELMPSAIIFEKKTTDKGKSMTLYKMLVSDTMYDVYF